MARQLALARHVERLLEDSVLKDYAEAARLLGITRPRMTQVMDLLGLSPQIQEQILTGDLSTISHWLGHAHMNTTNKYTAIDLDMKREAIGRTRTRFSD